MAEKFCSLGKRRVSQTVKNALPELFNKSFQDGELHADAWIGGRKQKHIGPGSHPSGSDQDVHAGDGGGSSVGSARSAIDEAFETDGRGEYKGVKFEIGVAYSSTWLPDHNKPFDRDLAAKWLEETARFEAAKGKYKIVRFESDDFFKDLCGEPEAAAAFNVSKNELLYNYDQLTKESGPYRDGFVSSDSDLHFIAHEMGHVLHGDKSYKYREAAIMPIAEEPIKKEVSPYAATHPLEFVAEVFAGKVSGKTYSDRVMNYYKTLEGPDWEGVKK